MIAAFLGLRLYSVLGRRAEHEEEPIQGRMDAPANKSPRPARVRNSAETTPANNAQRAQAMPAAPAPAERGLREIGAADRRFDAFAFIEGARGAYRLILEAFWRGDKDELRQLCDHEVFESFAAAIDARTEAGETVNNRLIRIEEATISDAEYRAPMARITIRFHSDIASVTRNAEGVMIAGSLNDAVEAHDIWTFMRNVQSADPDWVLEVTDEA
jgi:predicted lipid-binding transport protein (Tim44 family)